MPQTTARPSNSPRRSRPKMMQFAETVLTLRGQPLCFDDRPHLDAIFRATEGNVIIRAGRQVEKSSFITFRIAYEIVRRPGTQVLLVCPREAQTLHLMRDRFMPLLEESPLLRSALGITKRLQFNPKAMRFPNGSQLFARSAFRSADAARGISADILFVDEFQDVAAGFLPVLKEVLSHASQPRTVITGTAKTVLNHLENVFATSTANSWLATCTNCGNDVIPDEQCMSPDGYWCPACHTPVDWLTGRWVAGNPHSQWGQGFWMPQLIAPWIKPRDIQSKAREYDHDRFLNEVLGMPTTHGTLAITRGELEACCVPRSMAMSAGDLPPETRGRVMMGVDWGSGVSSEAAVVIATECPHTQKLRVWHWALVGGKSREPLAEVVRLCGAFSVAMVFADARGGGAHQNRSLCHHLGENGPRIVGLVYGDDDGRISNDGSLQKWSISKVKWIGGLVAKIREKLVEFPQSADCQEGFTHVGNEQVLYDEETRSSRYCAADEQADDLLHPLTYVLAARHLVVSDHDLL